MVVRAVTDVTGLAGGITAVRAGAEREMSSPPAPWMQCLPAPAAARATWTDATWRARGGTFIAV
eukprot:5778635-Prymnesium_polylepis.2